jgi:phosphoribosylformylglycinamidine synthase
VASKEWIYRQYDHMVRLGTVVRPGAGDAAVVRILDGARDPEHAKGVALATDCNSRFCLLDPFEGARLAVAECYRNLSTVGAEPLAITDCLNFGSPERPEIMWQLTEAIRGLGAACRALETPVVSGNVSLYNDTEGRSVKPTPTVGMVGLLSDASLAVGQAFPQEGGDLRVGLLGINTDEIGGSEYLATVVGRVAGLPPRLDTVREAQVGRTCRALVAARLVAAAHDCSEGGLGVALAECCITGTRPRGARIELSDALRADLLLFGEAPSRILVTYRAGDEDQVRTVAASHGAPFTPLGEVGGERLVITHHGCTLVDEPVSDLQAAWRGGLPRILGVEPPKR